MFQNVCEVVEDICKERSVVFYILVNEVIEIKVLNDGEIIGEKVVKVGYTRENLTERISDYTFSKKDPDDESEIFPNAINESLFHLCRASGIDSTSSFQESWDRQYQKIFNNGDHAYYLEKSVKESLKTLTGDKKYPVVKGDIAKIQLKNCCRFGSSEYYCLTNDILSQLKRFVDAVCDKM